VKHALQCLKGTIDEGITFDRNLGMRLECWSDASWGGEEKRESVFVSYSLMKQTSIALSSTESEYMVLTHALEEQIWILCFLKEIGYDASGQNTIYCDNQSAIALDNNPKHHAQTKHIDIQYHFVRNCKVGILSNGRNGCGWIDESAWTSKASELGNMIGMGVYETKEE
jgi:hypothetical protein